MHLALATTDIEIERCFPILQVLRPHLIPADFVGQVRRQMERHDYQLLYLEDNNVQAIAGFRISECLAWGRFLYVDDLVTQPDARSQGYGGHLFHWLIEYAQVQGCQTLHLDSGVQRFAAHRFYFRQRMEITSHHFALTLHDPG